MKKLIVFIYDKVACVYNLFGDFANKGVIFRTFTDLLKDSKFMCSAHPSDYDVIVLGELDVMTGVIQPLNEKLCCLSELVDKEPQKIMKVGE